jgi:NitT/TauT family transport system substrate-binding protein
MSIRFGSRRARLTRARVTRARVARIWLGAAVIAVLGAATAQAESLKIAVPQRGLWDTSIPEFAQKQGWLKEAGLDVEILYTDGGGATLQAVISGSVDLGMANGTLGVMGVVAKGAPVRIVSAQMTGTPDLYWYAKADSGIKSLKDLGEGKTASFSAVGSSSNLILLALLKQAGSKAKPVSTGGPPATLTQVMTGQIDVGWGAPPFGLKELNEKKIVIVARSADAAEMKDQTVRVNLANLESLKSKRDAITKFMQVYQRTLDWCYSDPKAIDVFAETAHIPHDIAKQSVDEFYPKQASQIGEIRGLDRTLKDALDYKYIPAPMTLQQVEAFIDIVYKPGK